ncbi:hypothetical protein [Bacillus sp. AFS053548]|uniref:hypothetical protein n=1 Tax=Bacillus sp. AFS053548 TaxID=2033505 RepID=UPI00159BB982|nr:hypothetical protein [Bacillus sp. AFS053548]
MVKEVLSMDQMINIIQIELTKTNSPKLVTSIGAGLSGSSCWFTFIALINKI